MGEAVVEGICVQPIVDGHCDDKWSVALLAAPVACLTMHTASWRCSAELADSVGDQCVRRAAPLFLPYMARVSIFACYWRNGSRVTADLTLELVPHCFDLCVRSCALASTCERRR